MALHFLFTETASTITVKPDERGTENWRELQNDDGVKNMCKQELVYRQDREIRGGMTMSEPIYLSFIRLDGPEC